MEQNGAPAAGQQQQDERPNPHLAWVVEWGAISLPLGHPSRVTCLSIHDNEHDAACDLYATSKNFNARMWPISLNVDGVPGLVPEIAERSGLPAAAACAEQGVLAKLVYERDGRWYTALHGDTDVTDLVAAWKAWSGLLEAARAAIDYYPTDAAPGYMSGIREAVAAIDAALSASCAPKQTEGDGK